MSSIDIIRAWKDEEYRNSLTQSELATLPKHPAGIIELPDDELVEVVGGADSEQLLTFGCCRTFYLVQCGSVGVRTWGCCPTDLDEVVSG